MGIVLITGHSNANFSECGFKGAKVVYSGSGDLTATDCNFSKTDEPVSFDSDGILKFERNRWSTEEPAPSGESIPYPGSWLIARIVERHFGR